MQEDQDLTVVVVTYNSRKHIAGLAASLPGGMAGIARWRLVVVDNNSQDGTPEEVERELPDASLILLDRNLGYAAAINVGVRASEPSGAVLVLNPDVCLEPNCARELVAALDEEAVGMAVPRLLTPGGRTSHSLRREPSVRRVWAEALLGGRRAARLGISEVVVDPALYDLDHDVEWATGAVLAISERCRAAIGDWDESFFLYSEEVDYCRRARRAGFTIRYVPAASARHEGGQYETNPHLWSILVRNRARDYRRHHTPTTSLAFQLGLAANAILRSPFSPAHRAAIIPALRPRDPGPAHTIRHQANQGFLWFAAQDWWYHNQAHSDFQLMREVARTQRVLVVNSLGLRLPRKGISTHPWRRILRKLRSTAKFVRRPVPGNPNFFVMTPIMLPLYGATAAARWNAWLIRQQVRAVARVVGIGALPAIGVTIPTAWPVVRKMTRSALIFNRSDLHSAFPEADHGWVESLENDLLSHSDRVIYVSHELMRQDRDQVGDCARFLDHGVDLDHFELVGDEAVADEVAVIPRPRIGFFGGLDDYVVDMELLRRTAVALPDMQLVLIGDATCSMDELTSLPNVHWLGYRPYESIPSLGRGFDVAIMPWLDNEWIRFANPIKLKEYLALGLPVVSTEYPEVEEYREQVWVAKSRIEFPDLIKEALAAPGDPAMRRSSVLNSSWKARARTLLDITEEVAGA